MNGFFINHHSAVIFPTKPFDRIRTQSCQWIFLINLSVTIMTTFIMTWARVRLVVVAIHSFAQSFGEREEKNKWRRKVCSFDLATAFSTVPIVNSWSFYIVGRSLEIAANGLFEIPFFLFPIQRFFNGCVSIFSCSCPKPNEMRLLFVDLLAPSTWSNLKEKCAQKTLSHSLSRTHTSKW